jgi:hypothetical protein
LLSVERYESQKYIFYFQGHLSLGIITTLLVLANSDIAHKAQKDEFSDTTHQNHEKEEAESTKRSDSDSTDETEGAESQFVPSFGPPQHPQHYYNPPDFHALGTSPILAYRHMFDHGYPYACTFPYSKYVTPFVSSPPDSYTRDHHPTPSYYPHVNVKFPYAEEYLHYLPHAVSQSYYPTHHFGVNLHPGDFYPTYYRQFHDHYSSLGVHQPPVHVRPRSNPHTFHSVVNYGYINLHHGDHFEPHGNGNTIPYHAGKWNYRP